MAQILSLFALKKALSTGIHKTAVVPKSCKIGKGASIGAYVVLEESVSIGDNTVIYPHAFIGEESRIGRDCVLHSHVSIYDHVRIGDRVIIHAGSVIGVDGYGYVFHEGRHIKIPQIGKVAIEDEVEIYSHVCISRATLGETVIGKGTKIDKNCAVVSLVGFAGSVTLEDHVYVAGQAGFNGHIKIGENSVIMARAGVTKDIPPNSVVSGFPAQDHRKEIGFQASLRRLAKKSK
jgi:UDP-3-O-[3-hydroxymyristoyl] glucosamine N-acyltransferase